MNKIESIKLNEFYTYNLLEVYKMSGEKYANLSDEELKEYFCSQQIPFRSKYPKVSNALNFKGQLRISWSFDIKYNKNIDLIFFPENNPYINYAVLYAKDFLKSIDNEPSEPRSVKSMNISYGINYDFVKEILSKAGFSELQQKRFFTSRFGSIFVPIEVEFEWFVVPAWLAYKRLSFYKYDEFVADSYLIGIIKSHKILSQNQTLNFPQFIKSNLSYEILFKPLPTSALAYTKTKLNDFIINVQDKPDKNGKMIAQLFSHQISTEEANLKCPPTLEGIACESYHYKFGQKQYKIAKSYYKTNKSKLTNPLWKDDYLVLIWDILPNDWCKVWVLKMIDENTVSNEDNEVKFKDIELDIFNLRQSLIPFIDGSYAKTFNQTPSKLKLYEGYIHSSNLEYLAPFGENYIKR